MLNENVQLNGKTVLVTGAAGFIGANLTMALLRNERNISVVGLDNVNDYYDVSLKEYRLENIRSAAEETGNSWVFARGDLANREQVESLFRKYRFDVVVNLAAQAGVRYSIDHPEAYMQSNVIGFYNILEACRSYPVEHLVYASSSSVYGPAGRPDMAYFGFTNKLIRGQTIEIFNFGNCKRDFTYVDDIVEGILRVMKRAPEKENGEDSLPLPPYRVYNIGNSAPENLLDFVQILQEELIAAGVLPEDYDFESHKKLVPMQPGDVPVTFADVSALEEDTGFRPKTSLREGLRQFARWYAAFYQTKEGV